MGVLIGFCLGLLCACRRPAGYNEQVHCDPAFVPVSDRVSQAVRDLQLDGGALLLKQNGQTVCEAYFGSYDERTVVPIASAAKWRSAATILTLVDDGTLALDDPVSKYLPYFTGDHGDITLRQLLSHTSGLPDYSPCMFRPDLKLDECAREIAALDLLAAPGTQFFYSGAGYSVAGRMAEAASGLSWAELFDARMAQPLGFSATSYGNTWNPSLSEGYTVSSLREYGAFLQMMLDGGMANGQQVLSAASLAEMRRDQTLGTALGFSPRGADVTYGLGVWRDRVGPTGAASEISSPGVGGFVPWIDFDRNLVGVFMVYDPTEQVWETVSQVRQETRDIIDVGIEN
jgi:CubicO group peptidase (beta-lactamase class C family)